MNFWQKRKTRKTLRKFREGVASLRHADDDILTGEQKSGLEKIIADTRIAEQTCDPAAEKVLQEQYSYLLASCHQS